MISQLFSNRSYHPPGIVPWVFIVLSIAMLTTLGIWQMQRLVWKESLLAQIEAGQQLVPLRQLGDSPSSLNEALYRRIKLTGELDRSTYFLRVGIHQTDGKGYHILSPLSLASGARVMVSRGFIAGEKQEIEDALKAETAENPTTVEGILRPAYGPRLFTPSSHPDKNIWTSEDIAGMDSSLPSYVIAATSESPIRGDAAPHPSNKKIRFRNDHLTYAVTWFSLALTGVVMFWFYCFRRKEKS